MITSALKSSNADVIILATQTGLSRKRFRTARIKNGGSILVLAKGWGSGYIKEMAQLITSGHGPDPDDAFMAAHCRRSHRRVFYRRVEYAGPV
jgi:predicted nucleic acid-binding protein